jgi:hypothetical protein
MRTLLFTLLFLFLPAFALGAELSCVPSYENAHAKDVFAVDCYLDPQGENINAIEGAVFYSPNLLFVKTDIANSVVPLFVEAPRSQKGNFVSFSGIMPGGFQGTLSPSWRGYRPGKIFSLIFRANEEGDAQVSFAAGTAAYLNDGKGTKADLSAVGLAFPVLTASGNPATLTPVSDTEPPDPFTPIVTDGKMFTSLGHVLLFSAKDSGSGIDHYELASARNADAAAHPESLSWRAVESPHQLTLAEESGYLFVRAIDAAGNARLVIVAPGDTVAPQNDLWRMLILGLSALALLFFLFFMRDRIFG